MKFNPRTNARDEEEGDLLTTIHGKGASAFHLAGQVCKKLYKKYPEYTFVRTDDSHKSGLEISVTPSPEQALYNQMQGYAYALIDMLESLYE